VHSGRKAPVRENLCHARFSGSAQTDEESAYSGRGAPPRVAPRAPGPRRRTSRAGAGAGPRGPSERRPGEAGGQARNLQELARHDDHVLGLVRSSVRGFVRRLEDLALRADPAHAGHAYLRGREGLPFCMH